jgi:hypothetical protein
MLACIAGSMPMPVSRTLTTTASASRPALISIDPLGSVYLAALVRRFATTCARRSLSP